MRQMMERIEESQVEHYKIQYNKKELNGFKVF